MKPLGTALNPVRSLLIALTVFAALAAGVLWLQPPWFVSAFDLRGERGAISGAVVDEHGAPVANADVRWYESFGAGPSSGFGAQTDAQGVFLARGMEVGETGWLSLRAAGFATSNLDGVRGGSRELRIALERAAVLRVRLRAPAGSDAREFCLSVYRTDWSGSGTPPNVSFGVQDDGSFEYAEFPAGVYEIKVSRCREAGPYVALTERIVLRAGETTDAGTIEFEAGVPVLRQR